MKITVKLIGSFRINRFREEVRNYPASTTAQDIVKELEIPDSLLGTVLINDVHAKTEDLLRDGDTVCLLPFIDGG